MYVYRTSKFLHKAQQHNLQAQINSLCDQLETLDLDRAQAHFKRLYPYLKRKLAHNYRLVGKIVRVSDVLVLCLLDIFKRGDKDYEHFLRERIRFGKQYLDSQLSQAELSSWLTNRRRGAAQQPAPRPLLQEQADLLAWLEPPGWQNHADETIIYESEEWVRQFQRREVQLLSSDYSNIISFVESHGGDAFESTEFSGVWLYGNHNLYLLFSRIITNDTPRRQVLFLLAPFTHHPSPAEIAQIGETTNLFTESENLLSGDLSINDITSGARRAYPSYLLADDDWLAHHRSGSKQANLALSAEEEAILYSVSTSTDGHKSLPLFLNGRAGSGKSTMLFYLFTDYCYRKFYQKSGQILPGIPLFLTYNERLLEVAKDWVYQILAKHHRFVSDRRSDAPMPDISPFFQPFGKFLLHFLPKEVGSQFNLGKYMSFHRFKQFYQDCHLPKTKKYSPEHSWHVIRTFIKGYGPEEMTPESYQEEVPRKEQTVPVEKFTDIYYIYNQWYKTLLADSGYWDDQDLIGKLLELKCYRPQYTAIFCDEAQDFTRLELQLIMRLSVFSQYDLGYGPIKSLPFAFAGDPFQTLNPTGFRWESFKAAFHNEVITGLDPTGELSLSMNFQELKSNYRSSSPIVQFNNLIQFWRQLLFDLPELQPQTIWKRGQLAPQKFILGQDITEAELLGYVQDTIIIVPCEEGEEIAYIQKDEVLSKIFASPKDPPKNVLSPIAAKGLEFKRVILYKFGEACDSRIWYSLGRDRKGKNSHAPALELEYFFNKLYVAASRAIERLFVVDSTTGDQQLWRYASNLADLEGFLEKSSNGTQWQKHICPLAIGTAESAQELREDDPESIASTLEEEGLNGKNADLIRRAKSYYMDIGNTTKAQICEAWALKFEEQFSPAGHSFLNLGEFSLGWDCFWQGLCWSELGAWYNQHRDRKLAERPLVELMTADPQQREPIETFTQFLQECLEQDQLENNRFSKQWQEVLSEYAQRLGSFREQQWEREQWLRFGEVLEALENSGYSGMETVAGDCFYRAGHYERAVACYERSQGTKKREYYLAQGLWQGFPAGLEYLEKVGETERIVAEWEKADQPRSRLWLQYVAPALEQHKCYLRAFFVYIWLDEPAKVKACFGKVKGRYLPKLLKIWLRYLLRKQQWKEAIATVDKYWTKKIGSEGWKSDFVYQLANSRLVSEQLYRGDRLRYEALFKKRILPNWRSHREKSTGGDARATGGDARATMQQVGVALERIGGLSLTLDFYQPFCDHTDRDIRQFARERWLATKRKQLDYHFTKGESKKAEELREDIAAKSRKWRIDPGAVALKPPSVPRAHPIASARKQPPAAASKSATKPLSLRENTTREQLEYEVESFQIRHLTVRVMREVKQILITDALTDSTIRVDLLKYTVNFGEVTVLGGGDQLSFTVPGSGYGCLLINSGDRPHLELEFLDLSEKINIEL